MEPTRPNKLNRLSILVVCGMVVLSCNVVRAKQQRLEGRLQQLGLERRVETVGDGVVEYWIGGTGPDLLLLHGFGATAVWQWAGQVDAFAEHYRVIIPNLLWFGESYSSTGDFSLMHQVRTVVTLLDRVGSTQTHVIGLSYGGFVAYELATRHSPRVGKLVLSDSPGPAFQRADLEALLQRFGIDRLSELLVPMDGSGVMALVELGYAKPPFVPSFVRNQVIEQLYQPHRQEKMALLDTISDSWPEDDGSTLEAETLLIWGQHDPVFPLPLAEKLLKRLGDSAQLAVIDYARHAPNLEHPEEFNRLALTFLAP